MNNKELEQKIKENAIKSANAYKKNQQRIEKLEEENKQINREVSNLTDRLEKLEQAIFKTPAA